MLALRETYILYFLQDQIVIRRQFDWWVWILFHNGLQLLVVVINFEPRKLQTMGGRDHHHPLIGCYDSLFNQLE